MISYKKILNNVSFYSTLCLFLMLNTSDNIVCALNFAPDSNPVPSFFDNPSSDALSFLDEKKPANAQLPLFQPNKDTFSDTSLPSKKKHCDKLLAIIYHDEGTILICQSDLKADLGDVVPTLKDAILKHLVLLDAKKLKITVTDSEVDRTIARVQKQLKMTRPDLIDFFKERGLTFDEAKKELEKNLIVETTVEQRIKSKAYVPKSEIEKFDADNPIIFYTVKQAFVPFSVGSKSIQRAVVDQHIETGEILTAVEWKGPLQLKDNDFSADKAYIKESAPGTIVKTRETDEGISLLQLVEKKRIPLDERIKEISSMLGRERYAKAIDSYYKDLIEINRKNIRPLVDFSFMQ